MATVSFNEQYALRHACPQRAAITRLLGALALAAPFLFGIVSRPAYAQGGTMKMTRTAEIPLSYRICSNPVVWRPSPREPWLIALVGGEAAHRRGVTTFIDALYPDGRRKSGILFGFPVLRKYPPKVPPANNIAAADLDGGGSAELSVIDSDGGLRAFKSNGRSAGWTGHGNPVHSFLVWQPMRASVGGASALLLVSRDAETISSSKDAVDLIAANGKSYPGFPVELPSAAEQRQPIIDPAAGRAFILLENGQVEAFQLAGGSRPPGFPAGPDAPDVIAGTRQMAMLPGAKAIFISNGTDTLTRIDAASGAATSVIIPGAQRLTGLAGAGERLYAFDDAANRLISLDAKGATLSSLQLNLPRSSRCYSLQAVETGPETVAVLLASSPDPDPHIKVAAVFEKLATPEAKKKVREIADADWQSAYGTLKRDAAQRMEYDNNVADMQRSYLEHHLGETAASDMLADEPLTSVQAIRDGGGSLSVVMEDRIDGYVPATGFAVSPTVLPAATIDAGGLVWVVPANIGEREDPKANNRSLLRIYKMQP